MKRMLIIAVILLLVAAVAAAAHADGPVNPYREEAMQFEREILSQLHRNESGFPSVYGEDYQVGISVSGEKKPCQTLTFTAQLGDTQYTADELCFKWRVLDTGRDTGTMFTHNYDVGTDTFEYYFYSAGTYYVMYSAFPQEYKDSSYWPRYIVSSGYMQFTIPEDGVHPTLEEKAAEICNACKGATKWDTALSLYEWLTSNCDYDYDYHRYGEDIIFSGSGVCDAFSKAYMRLLSTAGIPVNRAFGPNHAWNVLQLDGKWYQADPTWDDRGTHEFFCLSAAALIPVSSHSYEDGSQEGEHVEECTSMDANYFIHTGKWQEFGDSQYDDDGNYRWVSCAEQVRNELAKGNVSFPIECWKNGEGWSSNAFSYPSIANAVIEAGLQGEELFYGTEKIRIRTEATDSNIRINVFVAGWDIDETGTLTLPASVETIASEACAGTGATTVVIPSGCVKIGEGAFRNSRIRTAIIPDTVTVISDDAFDGCGKIIFITGNETAVSYANEHGILVISP